jgi:hypothetical protein
MNGRRPVKVRERGGIVGRGKGGEEETQARNARNAVVHGEKQVS